FLLHQQTYFFASSAAASGALISSSSTSKIKVDDGGIGPWPPAPYAKSDGITISHFEPCGINCRASVQPAITPSSGKETGPPFLTELSNSVPSINLPV